MCVGLFRLEIASIQEKPSPCEITVLKQVQRNQTFRDYGSRGGAAGERGGI